MGKYMVMNKVIIMLVGLLLITGCYKEIQNRGYTFDPEVLDSIKEGMSKEEVNIALGTFSAIGDFGDETWYYISNKSEKVAFFMPKTIEQEVLELTFSPNGNLVKKSLYTINDVNKVQFAKDVTPTEGDDYNFIKQILGNVGRFKGSRKTGATPNKDI